MTNNIVQMSELVLTHNETDSYITEFGRVSNRGFFEDVGLGTFTTYVDPSTKKARIEFVPYPADPGFTSCLLYTSPSPRDGLLSRMPSSA